LLGLQPHWPPLEDQDRWLLLVFPAVVVVELAAAVAGSVRWLVWLLRLLVAVSAARVLLHNSIYLQELAGPGSREWTPTETWIILAGLAAALAGVWAALLLLVRRTYVSPGLPPRKGEGISVLLAVALTCAGAAVTVMLSGYASAGQLGLPLAAALTGAGVVLAALPGPSSREGILGVGIVGLFALLVLGRFFGQLATEYAALLFFGTLLCWLPELRYLRRMEARLRGVGSVLWVAIPVAITVTLAQQKFVREANRTSSDSPEPTIEDYLKFGK
jgi:hypothetical protein